MKKSELESKIIAYFEETLSLEETSILLKEVQNSSEKKELFEMYQLLYKELDTMTIYQPSSNLKNNFHQHLVQKNKQQNNLKPTFVFSIRPLLKYAAIGLILVTFGTLIGLNWSKNKDLNRMNQELIAMRTEMKSLLQNESTSVRIKAVNMSNELEQSDEEIINVLLQTMNGDESENVRLAAIDALEKFAQHPKVNKAFLNNLTANNSDFIKIKIINILATIQEQSALRYLDEIINDKAASHYLKKEANDGKEAIVNL